MKLTTDPKTGLTTCELSTQDRKSLAAAKTVMEKLAFHGRETDGGEEAAVLATGIEAVLAGKSKVEA
uniref:Uncharacterized protein n=1 Tax=viral metagenome TaxID=1070528 RepID=A0A6M3LCU5_9ZZZZ